MATSSASLKRALRLPDLILLNIVAVYTPNTLAQNMPLGASGLLIWALGILAFMWPYGTAISQLSRLLPREGGVYAWTHLAFGNFHGFICGWCYWVNTFFYVPSVFLGIAAIISLLGGGRTAWLNEEPWAVCLLAIGTLWVSAILHMRGLEHGKWLQNIGAVGRLTMAAAILVAAVWRLVEFGMPSGQLTPAGAGAADELDLWRRMALWPFTLNALVGLDLGAAMSDEADAPARDIPRSLLVGGLAVGLCYLLTYGALLIVGFNETNVIYGHILAVNSVIARPDHALTALLGGVIIVVELLGLLGSGAAWLAAPARVPFAIGIDRYLPQSFANVHPRFGTPYVALLVQAGVATVLILINIYGATLQEAYLALLGGSIVLVMVTYLYLFGAWQRLRKRLDGGSWPSTILSGVGILATAAGIVACFIPPPVVAGIVGFELKIVGSVAVMLIGGLVVYFLENRHH
ncbi:MAG: APC family permease [Acidobacteriota bacterium]